MAFDLLEFALEFIAEYGLLAIFILLVLDGAMLMPVLPGEVIMIMAVTQYATGPEDLVMLVLLATAAAMVGSIMLYGASRAGGRPMVEKHPRLFMMSRRRREKLEHAFQHPVGQGLVLFLRLIPLTRVLVNIPAGVAKMPFVRFFVLSLIGMLIFHAGFFWLAFEFRKPDSHLAEVATAQRDAYASPAWEFMQANTIITIAALLVLGIVLSLRASRRMRKDPDESAGSLIGMLSRLALFWGGLALLVALYVDPFLVYKLAETGGIDVTAYSLGLPYEPLSMVAAVAATATVLGMLLIRIKQSARRRNKQLKAEAQDDDQAIRQIREDGEPEPSPKRKQRDTPAKTDVDFYDGWDPPS